MNTATFGLEKLRSGMFCHDSEGQIKIKPEEAIMSL